MKLKTHANQRIYAYVKLAPTGRATPISTGCTSMSAARKVVKDANLEQIELAARAKSVNVAALGVALSGGKLTNEKALHDWLEIDRARHSANTVEINRIIVNAFLRDTKLLTGSPLLALRDDNQPLHQ